MFDTIQYIIKEETTGIFLKCFNQIEDNGNKIFRNLWDAAKAVLGGKF